MFPSLVLKAASPNGTTQSQDNSVNAILCTDNESFQIRQVQSSNSLFVIKPSQGGHGVEPSTDAAATVTAIKQCPTTLELVPISPDVKLFLRKHLPIYNAPGHATEGISKIGAPSTPDLTSRQALLHDAPFSDGEFERAWTDMCCFDVDGQAYIPSSHDLLGTWRMILYAATTRGLNLGEGFSVFALRNAVSDEILCLPMLDAIVKKLTVPHVPDNQDGMWVSLLQTKYADWFEPCEWIVTRQCRGSAQSSWSRSKQR